MIFFLLTTSAEPTVALLSPLLIALHHNSKLKASQAALWQQDAQT